MLPAWALAATVLVLAPAAAQTLVAFPDPAGDTQFNVPPVPVEPAWGDAVDIVSAEVALSGAASRSR